jgi:hypothetical protein
MILDHFQQVTSSPPCEVLGGEPLEAAATCKKHLDADCRTEGSGNPRSKPFMVSDKDLEDLLNDPPTNERVQFTTQLDTESRQGFDAAEYVLMSCRIRHQSLVGD